MLVAITLVWKLASLTHGYSSHEQQTLQASTSLQAIWNSPLNAPFHVLVHLISYITPDNILATRLASVTVAWLAIIMFAVLAYRWFGTRTAVLGTILFGTSSIFLHVSRLGTPDSVFLGIISLVACGVWLRERKAGLAVILGLLIAGILLYSPGMVWLVAAGLLWQWKHIDAAFKQHPGSVAIGSFSFLAAISPLLWHFYKTPTLVKAWLGISDNWHQPLHFAHNLIDVPLAIFYRGQANPEQWLGRLPVLSIVGTLCFALGAYIFYKHFKLARVKFFIVLGLLGSVVIALGDGSVPLIVLTPFIYLMVAVGANYIIQLWLDVFPRNPLARGVGIAFFGLVISSIVIYNTRSYFVAWPQAEATQKVFTTNSKTD